MLGRLAPRALIGGLALFALLAGCAGAAPASAPAPTPRPVVLPSEALERVVALEPQLTGIAAFDSGLIGQSSWYIVQPASGVGAFVVMVRVGWGDCESGCIDEHTWTYAVVPDGTVRVLSESGPVVPPDAWPSPAGDGRTGIGGTAVAGPVCPVERVPPDPACAPRPVAGAVVVVRDGSGSEIARTVTAADGSFFVEVPAGDYVVEAQPAEGLLGTAGQRDVSVVDGVAAQVQLEYDTGIR